MTAETKRLLRIGGAVIAAVAALGAVVLVSGVMPIAASSGHWGVTEAVLHFAMRRSIATHSLGISPPEPLDDPALVMRGAGHYHAGCAPCHGAPGGSMPAVPAAMTPPPPPLAPRIGELDAEELFTIVKHGVKFTGMPAFPTQERDDEVWAVVAFLQALPNLDEASYDELTEAPIPTAAGRDTPELVRGRCAPCHGLDGQGRVPGAFPKLAGQREAYLIETLAAYADGRRPSGIMGPIAISLSDEERRTAAAHYAGVTPMRGGGHPPNPLGESIATRGIPDRLVASCQDCHGPSTEPKSSTYPILAGQNRRYLVEQLTLFRGGARGGGRDVDAMQEIATHELSEEEVAAVAAYYAQLSVSPTAEASRETDR